MNAPGGLRIVLTKLAVTGLWRASLEGMAHVSGTGPGPEEAVGWLILRNPRECGVGAFRWDSPAPSTLFLKYPEGEVERIGDEQGDEQ